MHRQMDRKQIGELALQASAGRRSAMRGAIVHNPEASLGLAVRRLLYHVSDERAERWDAGRRPAATKDLRPQHVPRSSKSQGPAALVFNLKAHRLAWLWRQRGMQANAGLNTGPFVDGNDELVTAQGLVLSVALVDIQRSPKSDLAAGCCETRKLSRSTSRLLKNSPFSYSRFSFS